MLIIELKNLFIKTERFFGGRRILIPKYVIQTSRMLGSGRWKNFMNLDVKALTWLLS